MEWNVGVMEYWGVGPIFHYSSIPPPPVLNFVAAIQFGIHTGTGAGEMKCVRFDPSRARNSDSMD